MINKKIKLSLSFLLLSLISLNSCAFHSSEPEREKIYAQYKIPNLNLEFFADNRKDILIDYLTKSFEWHVFPIYGTIIAKKRVKSKICNPVIASFPSSYPDRTIPGLSNFLNLYPDISKIRESSSILKTRANENSQITLTMEKPYRYPNETLPISHALSSDLIIGNYLGWRIGD
jgi:hypothetical protein